MTKNHRIESIEYSAWEEGSKARLRGQGINSTAYTSMNMQVYEDGSLGTRPWLRVWNTTSGPTSALMDSAFIQWRPTDTAPDGELWVGYFGTREIWAYVFGTPGWSQPDPVPTTGTINDLVTTRSRGAEPWGERHGWDDNGNKIGSAVTARTPEDRWIFGGEAFIDDAASPSETATDIVWTGVTNAITNFQIYRDRIWGWHSPTVTTNQTNRLYYTNAGDYTLADAGNNIDIGADADNYYIVGAWAMRDSLLIAMSDNSWYAFTGTPDAGSLRYIGNYEVPAHGGAAAVLDNQLYFTMPRGRGIAIASPSGIDSETFRDIKCWIGDHPWTTFHDCRVMSSPQEHALHHSQFRNETDQTFEAVEYVNGAWVNHRYGVDRFDDTSSNLGYFRDSTVIDFGHAYAFLMEDPDTPSVGSGSSMEGQVYTRDIVLNRPSRSSDTYSNSFEVAAGNGLVNLSKGGVRLAPFGPAGEEVRVREVTVDFRYWKSSNSEYTDPEMRCVILDGGFTELETIDTFSASGLTDFATLGKSDSWDFGIPYRWIFRFPLEDQDFRQSIQVQLDDLLSVTIDRIMVDYEIRPDNHWGGQRGST